MTGSGPEAAAAFVVAAACLAPHRQVQVPWARSRKEVVRATSRPIADFRSSSHCGKKEESAMKYLLTCLLIGALAVPALADQNPNIRIYLEADPNNHVHEIHPNASETFDVYICLD
jgi:hypothetical protein